MKNPDKLIPGEIYREPAGFADKSSNKNAPIIAGIESIKEKLSASSLFIPTSNAEKRVNPDRENPGTSAKD